MSAEIKKLLGSDIRLAEFLLGTDIRIDRSGDIDVTSEESNLAQAILHRLRTLKGELSDIGHPNYGSTLYEFVGQPNNSTTRTRLRLAIRDTLLQEPRIKEVVDISVTVRMPRATGDGNKMGERSIGKSRKAVRESMGGSFVDPLEDSVFSASVDISSSVNGMNVVDVNIIIIPIGKLVPLNLVFPFYLEVT
jgi:phage baseplate assembly protein W